MKKLAFWITATVLISGVVAVASGIGDEGRMPELDGAVAWVNSAPLSSKAFARQGGGGQLLDVLVHQQLARAALHEGMGGKV